ncbi:metalloprotease PmbA [Snodgrassella communis]|uniref:metalloprotease PmbA n=1 Tax=Snodgrassella communis TaxID=2946699 RepID=UPI000C1F8191|nr:metalloprotease PmbA [Snodgrassella communis]PIT10849.1 metalloprotease PmbA [Snodgrassella communis]
MMFHHSAEQLQQLSQQALHKAIEQGANAAEIDISESVGQNVQVRQQDVEHIEYQQDKSLDVTVYLGQAKGRASTADFNEKAIEEVVTAALNIARYTAQDDCAGLADAALLATELGDTEVFFPWSLSADEAIAIAKRTERAALDTDERISNSEGADVQTDHYQYVYANSNDFCAYQRGSRHSISCSVVAADDAGMQRDYWYDLARDARDLDTAETIGQTAAARTVRRLNSQSVATGKYPVIFDTTVAGSLIGHLVGALSGGALYRQTSFLVDSLGKQILAPWVCLTEKPHVKKALASTYFDAEGVATHERTVIDSGHVAGYFLSSYSARKLGMTTTGNAGGVHNLYLNHTHATQAELLQTMGTGLLVTELMGQGVNGITGDYSRGAAGFWVENGVIVYPVEGITIASRLQDMFMAMAGAADDALRRSTHKVGSILIDNMTVAGA